MESARSRSRPKPRDQSIPGAKVSSSANRTRPMTAMGTTAIAAPPMINAKLSKPEKLEIGDKKYSQPSQRENLPQRPKTSGGPPPFNISGLVGAVDRFCFGATNQIELSNVTSSDLYERKNEILGNGVNAYYPEWSLYNNHSDGQVQSNESSSTKCYRWEGSKNCDFEFMNTGFRYVDDEISVSELQMEKDCSQEELKKAEGVISEGGDDKAKPGSIKKFMNSVLSMPLSQKLFGENGIPSVNLLSSAAKVGEQIYRAGVGVASALFSEQEAVRDDKITYNGYKIHTLGNSIRINSLIFHGPKEHKFRVVLQTKYYDEFGRENSSRHKCEPRIYVNDGKWTLIYGSFEEEGTGVVEIELPSGLSLTDITSEGPCNGLLFIDLP